jgi:hypothetical protein
VITEDQETMSSIAAVITTLGLLFEAQTPQRDPALLGTWKLASITESGKLRHPPGTETVTFTANGRYVRAVVTSSQTARAQGEWWTRHSRLSVSVPPKGNVEEWKYTVSGTVFTMTQTKHDGQTTTIYRYHRQ